MRRRLLGLFLSLVLLLPMACTKPAAGGVEQTTEPTAEPALETSNPQVQVVTSEEDLAEEEDESNVVKLPFSKNTVGDIFGIMNDCTGKDYDTAKGMLDEFFGTELINCGSNMMTEDGVTTAENVYFIQVEKDDLRFNRVTISTNTTDGTVCGVEFAIRNEEGDNAYAELTPVPELEEVRDMYESFTNEAVSICGEPYESGNLNFDEDSYWAKYKYGRDCIIKVEFYNYSSDNENGLIAAKFGFKNSSYFDVKE
ncbi:MAG: hypothetical protein K5776_09490 [Lachnospiraceae bacterium]|nr:hypothetical protein [Lachnospiraceae bacterium]